MLPIVIAWMVAFVTAVAFLGARYLTALSLGVPAGAARFGLGMEAWRGVGVVARTAFALAGPFACYAVAVGCFAVSLHVGGETRSDADSLRVTPAPGSAAETAGVESGDHVVTVDGSPVHDWRDLRTQVHARAGATVTLRIERDGSTLELRVLVSQGGMIGVLPVADHRAIGAGEALGRGLAEPFHVIATALAAFTKGSSEPLELVGPVGIVRAVAATPGPAPTAGTLYFTGSLLSYFLWLPLLASLVAFPRARRRTGAETL